MISKNVVICLAVAAAVLLVTGLALALASPTARIGHGTPQPAAVRQAPAQPGTAHPATTRPAAPG